MKCICTWCGKEFDGSIFSETWCSKKCEYEYKDAKGIRKSFF